MLSIVIVTSSGFVATYFNSIEPSLCTISKLLLLTNTGVFNAGYISDKSYCPTSGLVTF